MIKDKGWQRFHVWFKPEHGVYKMHVIVEGGMER